MLTICAQEEGSTDPPGASDQPAEPVPVAGSRLDTEHHNILAWLPHGRACHSRRVRHLPYFLKGCSPKNLPS